MAVTTGQGLLSNNAEVVKNLKSIYESSQEIMFKNRPLLAMIPKVDDLAGADSSWLAIIGSAGGVAADMATAQALSAGTSTRVKWKLDINTAGLGGVVEIHDQFLINEKTMRLAAQGNVGVFVDEYATSLRSMKERVGKRLNFRLFRKANGSICTVTYSANAATVTLNTISAHTILEIGDCVVFAADSTGAPGTLRASGTAVYVASINRTTGVVGFALTRGGSAVADLDNTITSLTTGDHILFKGDKDACIAGIQDWIAGSSVSATSFFNVDRTVDTGKLAGHVVTGSASIQNSLIEASEIMDVYSTGEHMIFMNPTDVKTLKKDIQSKVEYEEITSINESRELSHKYFKFEGVPVFSDIDVPAGKAFILNMKTWKIRTLGSFNGAFEIDGGNGFLSDVDSDARTVRYMGIMQLVCTDPSQNIIVNLP